MWVRHRGLSFKILTVQPAKKKSARYRSCARRQVVHGRGVIAGAKLTVTFRRGHVRVRTFSVACDAERA